MDIFISYSSLDEAAAKELRRKLERKGISSFLAPKDIKGGEAFEQQIRNHLLECKELFLLVTPNSLKSEWVVTEWGAAWALGKHIVPILLRCSPEELPSRLKDLQTRDFHELHRLIAEFQERQNVRRRDDEAKTLRDTVIPTRRRTTRGKKRAVTSEGETSGGVHKQPSYSNKPPTQTQETLPTKEIKKLLIIAVSPKNLSTLRLDKEVREICSILRESTRVRFVVEVSWAVRMRDLRSTMLDFEPNIVHFCGHGGKDGIILEDGYGSAAPVDPTILAKLFELLSGNIEGVLFNACYSEPQAKAISPFVGHVIGMDQAIADESAIEFSLAFYQALTSGRPFDVAYEFGCNAMQHNAGSGSHRRHSDQRALNFLPVLLKGQYSSKPSAEFVQHQSSEAEKSQATKRLLILGVNPIDTSRLRLSEEIREIYATLRQARNQGKVLIEQRWAVRFDDLQEALISFNPNIVHFSGHGSENLGLAFEKEDGTSNWVKTKPFASLFDIFGSRVECILLIAGKSSAHASSAARHVKYGIGMKRQISDEVALAFSVGFYKGLIAEFSYEQAYKSGCLGIRQKDPSGASEVSQHLIPVLYKKRDLGNRKSGKRGSKSKV